MRILADLHTHTVASTHAFCTLNEMITKAAEIGLELIATTDHAGSMPDASHRWRFGNFECIPREVKGVTVLCGAESNLENENGDVDFLGSKGRELDILIVSMHSDIYLPKSAQEHTNALINMMKHKEVDIIGHPARYGVPFDYEQVAKAAEVSNKIIEINENCLRVQRDYPQWSMRNKGIYTEVLTACRKYNTKSAVNSDAHYDDSLGQVNNALELIKSLAFPEELIVNRSRDTILAHLHEKKGLIV